MKVEAQPQTNLKNKVTSDQTILASYQAVNTKMQALGTAAGTLTQASTWQAATATSSSTSVVATAGTGAPTGTYTFDVTSLARAQVTTAIVPSSGSITTGSGLDI